MRVAITGHRPDKLGGYSPRNPMQGLIKEAILAEIRRLEETWGCLTEFVTGMALGVDQWALEVILNEKLLGRFPYTSITAAVPFRGQEAKWPMDARDRYRDLLSRCHQIVEVSPPGYSPYKLLRRNEWMITRVCSDPDQAGVVLAVYDGTSGGTGQFVALAEKMLSRGILKALALIDPKAMMLPQDPTGGARHGTQDADITYERR